MNDFFSSPGKTILTLLLTVTILGGGSYIGYKQYTNPHFLPHLMEGLKSSVSEADKAQCGNGTWQEAIGEDCDDGNQNSGDGCCSYCGLEPGYLAINGQIQPLSTSTTSTGSDSGPAKVQVIAPKTARKGDPFSFIVPLEAANKVTRAQISFRYGKDWDKQFTKEQLERIQVKLNGLVITAPIVTEDGATFFKIEFSSPPDGNLEFILIAEGNVGDEIFGSDWSIFGTPVAETEQNQGTTVTEAVSGSVGGGGMAPPPGGGPGGPGSPPGVPPPAQAQPIPLRIFVSSAMYKAGDIRGITGGNKICNQLAKDAGLGSEGKWAFLASAEGNQIIASQEAKDVLDPAPVIYTRVKRNRIPDPKNQKDDSDDALPLGTKQKLLSDGPDRPVLHTEKGLTQGDQGFPYVYFTGNSGYPWTGSDKEGKMTRQDCKNWFSSEAADVGDTGRAHEKDTWLRKEKNACTESHPIYCVEKLLMVDTTDVVLAQTSNAGPSNPIVVGGGSSGTGGTSSIAPSQIIPGAQLTGTTNVTVKNISTVPANKPPLPSGASPVDGGAFEVKSTQNLAGGGQVKFKIAIPETVAKTALDKQGVQYSADFWATPDLATKLFNALKLHRLNESTQQWEECPGFAHVGLPNIFEIGCLGTSIFTFTYQDPAPAPASATPAPGPAPSGGGGGGGSSEGVSGSGSSVIMELREAEQQKAEQEASAQQGETPKLAAEEKTAAAPSPINFTDVVKSYPYYDAIQTVAQKGIMTGTKDAKDSSKKAFNPKTPLNRAELTAIMTRWLFPNTHASAASALTCNFSDVGADTWFKPSVLLACENGLVKGYEDKSFKPEKSINYAEAIKVLVEGAATFSPNNIGSVLKQEKAAQGSDPWYMPYFKTAEKTQLLSDLDLSLPLKSPTNPASRGWVAQIIANIPGL